MTQFCPVPVPGQLLPPFRALQPQEAAWLVCLSACLERELKKLTTLPVILLAIISCCTSNLWAQNKGCCHPYCNYRDRSDCSRGHSASGWPSWQQTPGLLQPGLCFAREAIFPHQRWSQCRSPLGARLPAWETFMCRSRDQPSPKAGFRAAAWLNAVGSACCLIQNHLSLPCTKVWATVTTSHPSCLTLLFPFAFAVRNALCKSASPTRSSAACTGGNAPSPWKPRLTNPNRISPSIVPVLSSACRGISIPLRLMQRAQRERERRKDRLGLWSPFLCLGLFKGINLEMLSCDLVMRLKWSLKLEVYQTQIQERVLLPHATKA